MTATAPALDIKVGTYIAPDGWKFGDLLKPGLSGFCDFYLPTGYDFGVKMLACNIRVSGRKAQKRQGDWFARVEITFVGDGEPNTIHHGWTPCPFGWGYGEPYSY